MSYLSFKVVNLASYERMSYLFRNDNTKLVKMYYLSFKVVTLAM